MTLRARRRFRLSALLLTAATLLLAGCGTKASPTTRAPASEPASAPSIGTQPVQPKQVGEASILMTIDSIVMAPVWVALEHGFFEQEGIKVTLKDISSGGGNSVAALLSGDGEFLVTNSSTVVVSASKGVPMQVVDVIDNRLTMDGVYRNELVNRLKLTESMPILDRIKALKGMVIGITSPGSAGDLYTRYILKQGGLDPDKDVKFVAMSTFAALSAAMQAGQVDMFMASAPTPQQVEATGSGSVLMSAASGEIPGMDDFPYHVTAVMKDWAEKNPDKVRAVSRALGRANNYIRAQPDNVLKMMQVRYPKVGDQLIADSWKRLVQVFPKDGLNTANGWQQAIEIAQQTGALKQKGDPSEGVLWTNRHLEGLNGKAD